MSNEKLIAEIKTVKASQLSQSQRADVLDKLLEMLNLQVGIWKDADKEQVIFREVKE